MTLRHPITKWALLSVLILSSCNNKQPSHINYEKAQDIAWEVLQPYTSSGNRDSWEVSEERRVTGRDVVDEFIEARFTNCPGPIPPENKAIRGSTEYWYIKVVPYTLSPLTQTETTTYTAPPNITAPFIIEATFLIDPFNGQVVARKFNCITY